MTSVAVVAHSGKRLGGGLDALRETLAAEGFDEPLWAEVTKSRFASECTREALDEGADLVFVWGGDGTVQRCIDVLAGSSASLAILPAGTANLLATNLGIPRDLEAAVRVGLWGARRSLDVGTLNGERFAVMAGTGVDALMIRGADSGLKDTIGKVAYLWTGAKSTAARTLQGEDPRRWASLVQGRRHVRLGGERRGRPRRDLSVRGRASRRRQAEPWRGHGRRAMAMGAHARAARSSAIQRPPLSWS